MSHGNLGKKRTIEQRNAQSLRLKGKKLNPEWCKNISLGNIGLKRNKETCKNIGIGHTTRLGNTPFDRDLRQLYNITEEQYNIMLKEQNGVCAICHNPESSKCKGTLRRLAVDHNHKTGLVRGLLCSSCNRLLGSAKDNVEVLRDSMLYLQKHSLVSCMEEKSNGAK